MKEEACEPNRNENIIKHRIISWCGEHKMKLILAILVLAMALGGHYFLEKEECSGFTLQLDWDTSEGGSIVSYSPPFVEIDLSQTAKLNIKFTSAESGKLKVTIESPDVNIEIFDENGIQRTFPLEIEKDVLRGNQWWPPIYFEAPERPTAYGVTVKAVLNNKCELRGEVYFKVAKGSSQTKTSLFDRIINWIKENPCCGTSGLFVIMFSGIIFSSFKRGNNAR